MWGNPTFLYVIASEAYASLIGVASRREEKQSQNLQLILSLCDCVSATRTCVRRSSYL